MNFPNMNILENEVKEDEVIPEGKAKSSPYSAFAINIDAQGGILPTSSIAASYVDLTKGTFGGDGSDGELSITSGTTTIDLGSANLVVKNYTSISITGTGALAFSNPASDGTVIILKSKGNVVLTSSTNPLIDLRGMGASATTQGYSILDDNTHYGGAGGNASGASQQTGGTAGTAGVIYSNKNLYLNIIGHTSFVSCGSGGGTGGTGGNGNNNGVGGAGGAGGRGGASLII